MECTRCHGLMVRHFIVDLLLTDNGGRAWRCISCGAIIDPVILTNAPWRMHETRRAKQRRARAMAMAA